MRLSQTDRLIRIATPLQEDTFVVLSFEGTEKISGLYAFNLELASERSDIAFGDMAGKNVTVSIRSSDNSERFFNGVIVSFALTEISENEGYSKYSAVMRPGPWLLTQCRDCRIFQDTSVPDIIKQVLDPVTLSAKGVRTIIDHRLELRGSYAPREYCVQYNESDYAFISRLCEDEGIFFFFRHENGKHTLVFGDTPEKHPPCIPDKKAAPFRKTLGANLGGEAVTSFKQLNRLTTGRYTARDYNYTIPDFDQTVTRRTTNTSPGGQGETYEYPGRFEKSVTDGINLAIIRMEASDARIHTLEGSSNCRAFSAGFRFGLADHPVKSLNNKEYVLTRVRHEARQNFTSGDSGGGAYTNSFLCIPHRVPYRPERKTGRPVIVSSQTAIVTGPAGEEIHTDKHGRVKVKFFWDRRTDTNGRGNMSCWIRVSQNWAGSKWGGMHIPRVGQEVIVSFLEGDPDRPIITGRVYHAKNLPPYNLPAEKTKSTIKSNSSKGGGNYNEIRFEDKKGEEEVFTHAAKDQNEVIEHDMSTRVKNNQVVTVDKNRTITVSSGNEMVTIESGARDVSVKSNEKHTNLADFRHKVSGNYTLKVNGNLTIDASGLVRISGAKIILNG